MSTNEPLAVEREKITREAGVLIQFTNIYIQQQRTRPFTHGLAFDTHTHTHTHCKPVAELLAGWAITQQQQQQQPQVEEHIHYHNQQRVDVVLKVRPCF